MQSYSHNWLQSAPISIAHRNKRIDNNSASKATAQARANCPSRCRPLVHSKCTYNTICDQAEGTKVIAPSRTLPSSTIHSSPSVTYHRSHLSSIFGGPHFAQESRQWDSRVPRSLAAPPVDSKPSVPILAVSINSVRHSDRRCHCSPLTAHHCLHWHSSRLSAFSFLPFLPVTFSNFVWLTSRSHVLIAFSPIALPSPLPLGHRFAWCSLS